MKLVRSRLMSGWMMASITPTPPSVLRMMNPICSEVMNRSVLMFLLRLYNETHCKSETPQHMRGLLGLFAERLFYKLLGGLEAIRERYPLPVDVHLPLGVVGLARVVRSVGESLGARDGDVDRPPPFSCLVVAVVAARAIDSIA